jgi:hypothetical protein
MKKDVSADGTKVVFTFTGLEPIVFDPAKASEANRAYAQMHGWMAAIGDKAAIQKSAENNYTVTEEMRRAEILEAVTFYEAGGSDWTRKAKAKAPSINPAIAALAAALGMTYEATMAKLAEDAVMAMKAGE